MRYRYVVTVDSSDVRPRADVRVGRQVAKALWHSFGEHAEVHHVVSVSSRRVTFGERVRYVDALDDGHIAPEEVAAYRAEEGGLPDLGGLDDMERKAER